MRKLARKSVISLVDIAIAVLIGFALIVGVFMISPARADKNIAASATLLRNEGTYYKRYTWCHCQQDNWTDGIILLEAANDTDNSTLNKALMVYRDTSESDTPLNELTSHYLDGTEYTALASYARYWHGYLVVLKPLLSIMTFKSVRVLNAITQTLLFLVVCALMYKKDLKLHIISYVITYLILMPVVLMTCMQYSSCYYGFTLGMLALLLLPQNRIKDLSYIVFLNIGIFIAYFDLLSYPLITFGVPAVLLMALIREEKPSREVLALVENGIFWGAGYALMWAAKWVIATIFTDANIISDAVNQVTMRTSTDVPESAGQSSALTCIVKNYKTFFTTPFTVLFALAVITFTVIMVMSLKRQGLKSVCIKLIPYVLLAFLPVAWFIVIRNHSVVHFWFTNKICAVTTMAMMTGLIESFISKKKVNS